MQFTIPITPDDLDSLPDHTDTIESLTANDEITTVLPRFIGTEDTGRFVTAFFIFHGDNAQTVTLYTRRRTDGESSLEKRTTISLTNTPTFIGNTWNQTILIETPDIDTIEHLKQRAQYDTYWLSTGHTPAIPFDEYKHSPFDSTPTGFPDCDHTQADEPVHTPNIDMTISLCTDCGIPLVVGTARGGLEAHNTLRSEFVGIPHDEDQPVKGKAITPDDELTNAEVALHVLTRYAHAEQSHFDIYARNDHGYLITIGSAVAGYALWNDFDDHTVLQQIYILPEFRGNHLGEILVDAWYDHLSKTDHYYAIGPNDVGTATLTSAGHLDAGTATPATILSCNDTLDAGAVNASYADQIRRGNDPLQT